MAVQLRAPSRAVLAARPVRAARSVSFAAVAKAVRAPPPPAAASSRRGCRPGALRPRWAQPRRPFAAAPRRGGPKRGASAAQQAALALGAPSAVSQPRFDARCAGHRRATPWTRCAASSASSWAWTWTRCGGAAASLCPTPRKALYLGSLSPGDRRLQVRGPGRRLPGHRCAAARATAPRRVRRRLAAAPARAEGSNPVQLFAPAAPRRAAALHRAAAAQRRPGDCSVRLRPLRLTIGARGAAIEALLSEPQASAIRLTTPAVRRSAAHRAAPLRLRPRRTVQCPGARPPAPKAAQRRLSAAPPTPCALLVAP